MAYTTRKSLLNGVHDNDDEAWKQFEAFYAPLIYLCGHDCLLNQEEIKDLKQDVFLEVFKSNVVEKYDDNKGRFRDYLRKIIHRKAYAIYKKRVGIENCDAASEENESGLNEFWEREWHEFIMNVAHDELKEMVNELNFMAYDLYVNRKLSPQKVADILNITVNQVYIAKSRCVQLLTDIVTRLKEDDSI